MSYKVAIRNNENNEIRMYEIDFTDWEKPTHDDLFWWQEGNFSCDCNRGRCWENANNLETPEKDYDCGDDKFSVLYALLPDGRKILIDEKNNEKL